jgi:hypothetical protein
MQKKRILRAALLGSFATATMRDLINSMLRDGKRGQLPLF